jgi:hypothetical protein
MAKFGEIKIEQGAASRKPSIGVFQEHLSLVEQ